MGAALAVVGCGGEPREPRLEGEPVPVAAFGVYEGEAGRLVLRRAGDPACRELLSTSAECYTHNESSAPASEDGRDPLDAGPIASSDGGEVVLLVAYERPGEEPSCRGLRGHHQLVSDAAGAELRLRRYFYRDEAVREKSAEDVGCFPPQRWRRVS